MKITRTAAIILALLFSLTCLTVYGAESGFSGGSGSKDNPYIITTSSQLVQMAKAVNSGESYKGIYFKLENDISLNEIELGVEPKKPVPWLPIGNPNTAFEGYFDGGNHTISGLYIKNQSDCQGVFGVIGRSGTVTSLNLSSSLVEGHYYIGGIAGENNGIIAKCSNDGLSVRGEKYCGGIVGKNNGTVSASFNLCWIGRTGSNGGIAGENNGTIENCYNAGTVDGGYAIAGGIAGENKGLISKCYNAGNVLSEFGLWGNIAGERLNGNTEHCYYLSENAEIIEDVDFPLSTENMKKAESFIGFDFTSIWEMPTEGEYLFPLLKRDAPIPESSVTEELSEAQSTALTSQGTDNENSIKAMHIVLILLSLTVVAVAVVLIVKSKKIKS